VDNDAASVTLQVHSNWKAVTIISVILSVTQWSLVLAYGLPIPLFLPTLSSVVMAINLITQPLGAAVLRRCTENSTRNAFNMVHVNPTFKVANKSGFALGWRSSLLTLSLPQLPSTISGVKNAISKSNGKSCTRRNQSKFKQSRKQSHPLLTLLI